MSSINTNASAMTALQTLRNINKNLSDTQTAISTGKSVSTAKHNAALWSVAAVMTSDVQGFKGVSDALALAGSTIAVARSGAETVIGLMDQLKERIALAQSDNVDRAKIQDDVVELRNQITATINGSQFNGLNLLSKTSETNFLSGLNRTAATTVSVANITVGTQGVAIASASASIAAWDVSVATGAASALGQFEAQYQIFVDAAAALGSSQKRVELQQTFIKTLSDNLKTGAGALVDADMEETSARLQALQVQQQLGVQSLSIANQQPQTLLSLFR